MDRRTSNASQGDYMSLRELDPSPIESPEEEEKQLLSPPLNRSSTLGLSGGGHSSAYYFTRLQKYSSYVFTIYTSFHITNTSLIPLITRSVPASEQYLLLTRPYYQSFPLEPLLITLPIATHILSGLALRINRRNANIARYGGANVSVSDRFSQRVKVWPPVSWLSVSGYILTPLVLGHAFTNRLLPYIYEGGSSSVGLGFVSHGFARHPFIAWTGYVALIATAAGHFVWGAARWNRWLPRGNDKKSERRKWLLHGISAAVAAIWMAGGLGVIGTGGQAQGWIGAGYDTLYSRVPFVDL